MKYLLLALLFAAAPAMAEPTKAELEDAKKKIIKGLDDQVASLQKTKTCVTAASTRDGVQACKKQHHDRMMVERKAFIGERMKKLQDKQNKTGKK